MVLFRGVGWVLLAMAVAAIVHDCLAWWSEGAFRLMLLGDLWSGFDDAAFRPVPGAPAPGWLWQHLALPLLMTPALPAFAILGAVLLWIGRRPGGRPEASFLTASRPPRRRSSLS
ncbi:hypothetical protein [Enhydrobacter sp.]|jgi:hypothetical protein|uniref:hypothetical protein n=1 Tax=Enhydrobacter sp. TaxID=1894999 RepID=UPI002622CA3D|nr:hypothetical protein [Enhydrobacter sp.]WIM10137.1 MAG: hypothetical protein OJF58_001091 [Enhydrobacter sp.]